MRKPNHLAVIVEPAAAPLNWRSGREQLECIKQAGYRSLIPRWRNTDGSNRTVTDAQMRGLS
jgi:hypothetical protein